MQGSSKIIEYHPEKCIPGIKIDCVEIRLIRLPLVEPFETSFGKIDSRLIFLVCLEAEGLSGWGEVVAEEEPLYSYETVQTALHVIRDFLGPALLTGPIESLDDLGKRLSPFRGHNMAKAGLELAFMDLLAQARKQSLSELIGGELKRVAVGVSLGIQPAISRLLERVEKYLKLGYQRIKLKIKPGWDLDVVDEVRRKYPQILLSVDANAAYTFGDVDHLKMLDDFNLLMIEQPLQYDDLMDHARLQEVMKTRLCLDESIINHRQARLALELDSCQNNQHQSRTSGRLFRGARHTRSLCVAKRSCVVRRDAGVRHRSRAQHGARESQRFYFARRHFGELTLLRARCHFSGSDCRQRRHCHSSRWRGSGI